MQRDAGTGENWRMIPAKCKPFHGGRGLETLSVAHLARVASGVLRRKRRGGRGNWGGGRAQILMPGIAQAICSPSDLRLLQARHSRLLVTTFGERLHCIWIKKCLLPMK